jgi:malonate-semialdehyde dehydrogenase (acetylating) / methylmalonate-semialdehyde dehydrogenase
MRTIEHVYPGADSRGDSEPTPARYGPVWEPATGQQQARVRLAGPEEVDRAVSAARRAFEQWSQSSLTTRAKVMFAFRDLIERHEQELARVVSAEHGKVIDDARGEVVRGREVVEFACGIPSLLKGDFSDQVSGGVDSYSFRQPLGVCAGITPFNFPVMVPLWMHPVAIACGNSFVLKPSERDPSASNLIAQLYGEAGLPEGVFNVVHGDKVAVDAVLDHPGISAVSFVGSTPVARYVHDRATAAGKRVQALGGAKNHAVVLPDADLDFTADQLVSAGYGSAGQRCMAISAVVAVGPVADPLVDRLRARTEAIVVGPGDDPAAQMGPVVTAEARERVSGYVEAGERAGAKLVVDGRGLVVDGHEDGFFLGPSLIDQVTTEMSVYTEEVFGPVLVVLRVPELADAISVVNANPYGNGTAIFTSSGEAARAFQRLVSVGMVGINVPIPVPMAYYSFGGWKDSLFGDHHVHGPEGVRFYTQSKVVTSRWPAASGVVPAGLSFPSSG